MKFTKRCLSSVLVLFLIFLLVACGNSVIAANTRVEIDSQNSHEKPVVENATTTITADQPAFVPPFKPTQDFEIRVANYKPAELEFLFEHIDLALSKLPEDASEFEKVAAINDYLYQYLLVEVNATGDNAIDVLSQEHAICGGVILTMSEMLYAIGVKSKYAYIYGGLGAHSMVEVFFSDGTRGLFDPTYGLLYYNPTTHQPISIFDIFENVELSRHAYYTTHPKQNINGQITPLSDIFTAYADKDIIGGRIFSGSPMDPYAIFSAAEGGGVANEGVANFIEVELHPGTLLGEKEWTPDGEWPLPWGKLAAWQREDGTYLSWAYQMGQTLGYDIKHVYTLTNLEPGKTYTLRHYLARAYPAVNSDLPGPTITIQQIHPFGFTRYKNLDYIDIPFDAFEAYSSDLVFKAADDQMTFVFDVSGTVIITAIELVP